MVVEAVVPNAKGLLKPGLFVTARIEQGAPTPAVLVPAAAVVTTSGTSRVFVVVDDRVEERIVTTGQQVGDRVEATSGVTATDVVAVTNRREAVRRRRDCEVVGAARSHVARSRSQREASACKR